MMRSMFSGVSGLRSHQTKMDVIADNIANVNTVGFKSSRVTFNEVFSQLVSGASGANAATGRGGVNPMQIGLGVGIASIDKVMTTGFSQRTDRAMDLMINGNGFFIVGDGSGNYFTRAGAFDVDTVGNIVDPNGLILMGWNADFDGNIQKGTSVVPLNMGGDKQYMIPTATSKIEIAGNLDHAREPERFIKVSFFDSIGNKYTMDAKIEYVSTDSGPGGTGNTTWQFSFVETTINGDTGIFMYPNGDTNKPILVDDGSGTIDPIAITFGAVDGLPNGQTIIDVDFNNVLSGIVPGALIGTDLGSTSSNDFVLGDDSDPLGVGTIRIDLSGLTQFGNIAASARSTSNGNAPGVLQEFTVGGDGVITGRYTNGLTRTLGQVAIARFVNPGGLQKIGNNLFVPTSNSGEFDGIGEEVGADGSSIMGGVLEMSNVDLASEFTSIITTQRGFQANSRVITTSDEMLQELVNLKR